ncbi:MAG: flavodoxin family protein [Candidatus Bipolaricaulis sp.]|nr:flavodoxin family protein [Candidatus Bipolaricaulis sp.]MDY0391890.1 flavodoxin family protein [Candidatus Bipolaricaulis sp.]
MKVLGIVGSMRNEGNTGQLVEAVLSAVKEAEPRMRTQTVHLSELEIGPCQGCYEVCAKTPYKCVVKDDFPGLVQKMEEADGLVIGSPLYFPVPSRLVAVCERLVCLAYFHDLRRHKGAHLLEDKPCALVAATGGTDPRDVFQYLFQFAVSVRMTPLTVKRYPYYGVAGRGDLAKDEEKPLEGAQELGRLLAAEVEG